jgi:hypothetical protein
MSPEEEKINNIERLKGKLFSNTYETKIEYRDHFSSEKKKNIPTAWDEKAKTDIAQDKFFTKTSVFKKIFIFSIGFFILALCFVFYQIFVGGNTVSNENITISIFGNTFTDGGEDLPLQIQIINKNNTNLDLVDLVVEYPKSSVGGLTEGTERLRESIGTISAGGIHNENVNVILYGEQGSVRPVRVTIEYRVEGTNSIFVKEKIYDVTINTTPINISLDAPSEVTPNQDVVLALKTSLNSTRSLQNVLIKLDYPVGFQFVSAEPKPSLGNNVWSLGELDPGEEHDIYISGRMLDVFDGETKTFHIASGTQSASDKTMLDVVYNTLAHTILIQEPFVQAQLYINGTYAKEYVANSKSPIQGQIRWRNNLNSVVNDMVIRAKISGSALDRKEVNEQQGFYSSSEDVIIWDKNTDEGFAEVNPGENGSIGFSLASLPLFSTTNGVLSDPNIKIEISVSGKQQSAGSVLKEVKSGETKIIKMISDVGLVNKALYFSGPFNNTGTIPPKAESETTYTIVWSISNTSNSLSKVVVKATLPQLVRFVGTTLPEDGSLTYNSSTREVTWNVGNVPKGTGLGAGSREMAFQIGFTPSLSQVSTAPTILNEAVLTGHDNFANVNVKVNKALLTTRLFNDPDFPTGGDRVAE